MIKELSKSIREYKKASILTPIFVSLEVVMECIIPFIIAQLVNRIKDGCEFSVILSYGAVLLLMALMSLAFGALSGAYCATASCGFAKNLRQDLFLPDCNTHKLMLMYICIKTIFPKDHSIL